MVDGAEATVGMVSVPNQEAADKIAQALVEGRLAACVQAFPIKSTYSWEGEINTDDELLLLVKSRASLAEKIRELVVSLHPYDVPEVLFVAVGSGHSPYLSWIDSVTG
jgi:periplasmic divalent cation tolerance protein